MSSTLSSPEPLGFTWDTDSPAFQEHVAERMDALHVTNQEFDELVALFWRGERCGYAVLADEDKNIRLVALPYASDLDKANKIVHQEARKCLRRDKLT